MPRLKFLFIKTFCLLLIFSFGFLIFSPVKAVTVEQLQSQIDELQHLRELSENATKPLEGELDNLESSMKNAAVD